MRKMSYKFFVILFLGMNPIAKADRFFGVYMNDGVPLKAVEQILEEGRANIDAKEFVWGSEPTDTGTALWFAARMGYVEFAELLLKYKANPNLTSQEHRTAPLHEALLKGHDAIALLLIANGADVNCDHSKQSPLIIAATKGKLNIVQALLEKKANVNYRDFLVGQNALMKAASNGHVDIFKLLLPVTHDTLVDDFNGRTVKDHAQGNEEILALLARREPSEKLRSELENLKRVFLPAELLAMIKAVEHRNDITIDELPLQEPPVVDQATVHEETSSEESHSIRDSKQKDAQTLGEFLLEVLSSSAKPVHEFTHETLGSFVVSNDYQQSTGILSYFFGIGTAELQRASHDAQTDNYTVEMLYTNKLGYKTKITFSLKARATHRIGQFIEDVMNSKAEPKLRDALLKKVTAQHDHLFGSMQISNEYENKGFGNYLVGGSFQLEGSSFNTDSNKYMIEGVYTNLLGYKTKMIFTVRLK